MYILRKIGNADNIAVNYYEVDTERDMQEIDVANAPMGSRCYIINVGSTYALNSSKEWKLVSADATVPDWNQNDETAADFVKNRPFYMGDPVETVLLEETTFEFVNQDSLYASLLSESFELENGQTYAVSWDGTIYSCVCTEFNGQKTLGNLYIITGDVDTGEPFIIVNHEGQLMAGTQDTSASHTISISCTIREIVKIDKKYLPTSYGYNLTLEDPIVENQSIGDNSTFTFPSEITLTQGGLYWANIKLGDGVNLKGQMLSRAITDDSITTVKWLDGDIILSTTGVTNSCGANIIATIAKVKSYETVSDAPLAHQEGDYCIASALDAHVEGYRTTASGNASHAEGNSTIASGNASHAEGRDTTASGVRSHAEGYQTTASEAGSHAEGYYTIASGFSSHAEGEYTTASGTNSHAEGNSTTAIGNASHAEGHSTGRVTTTITSSTSNSTIINQWNSNKFTLAKGLYSHAEGDNVLALGSYSHAEGRQTIASGHSSHAEGESTTASGNASHAEGLKTTASGGDSHAEGYQTTASGIMSHAEGESTTSSGTHSHAEGCYTTALGPASHAEGHSYSKVPTTITYSTDNSTIINKWNSKKFALAKGQYSHAEGEDVLALNNNSHAEGNSTIASGNASHAEGFVTTASGNTSHAEGLGATASGNNSHAEGYYTTASGTYSHAEGYNTRASSEYQHVQGKYNIEDSSSKYAHIVGNGISEADRSNAHTLDWSGNAWYSGLVSVGTTTDVPTPIALNDLVTKKYVDGKVPNDGTTGQILKKTETGTEWADASQSGAQTYTATLLSAGWAADTKTQTVSVDGVTATSNGSLRIAQSATDEQFAAWGAAKPRVTAQAAGTLTVKAAGTVPTIDIPVEVLIV